MIDEEKVNEVPESAPAGEDRFDDDFVDDKAADIQAEKDAKAAEEAALKEATKEEPKEELDLHYVEEDENAVAIDNTAGVPPKNPEPVAPALPAEGPYEDERFQKIEDGRAAAHKKIGRWSIIKTIVVLLLFADLLLVWLLPRNLLGEDQNVPKLIIGISGSVVGLGAYIAINILSKRGIRNAMRAFVKEFYDQQTNFVFEGTDAENVVYDIDAKVSKEEFEQMDIYPGVSQVGSRANATFTYHGMDCALADFAAQKDTGRYLQTLFVGKFLRTHNSANVSEEGIAIYFKGGERAIPPEGIKNRNVLENSKRYIVVGSSADKQVLNPKFRAAMKELRTDKLLVDIAIQIKPGKTYWALGYEDTLMVLPDRTKFNPIYMQEYKKQLKQVLELAALLNE